MRVFFVHPGPLTYAQIFLRLEPIGLELVAAAVRQAGHAVRLLDLQVETPRAYFRTVERWRPDVVAFGCNYLANVPEIVDLAKETKARFPHVFICVGGHSASFTAAAMVEHSGGAIDCVLKGEGEATMPLLLLAIENGDAITKVPGTTHFVPMERPYVVRDALKMLYEAMIEGHQLIDYVGAVRRTIDDSVGIMD